MDSKNVSQDLSKTVYIRDLKSILKNYDVPNYAKDIIQTAITKFKQREEYNSFIESVQDFPSEVQEVVKKEICVFKKIKTQLEYLLKSGPAIIYACEPWKDYQTKFMSENVKDILGYERHKFLYNPSFWFE